MHDVLRPLFALSVRDYLQLAWLVFHVIPAEAVLILALFFAPKRFAVQKQFSFVAGGIDVNGRHLAFATGPGPVRKEVGHGKVGPPTRLINKKPVLFETGEVYDAEIGTARRHVNLAQLLQFLFHSRLLVGIGEIQKIAHVAVVRRRLAEIIEASPHELAGDVRKFILPPELGIRYGRPARRIKVVRTHLEIGLAVVLVVADGEEILAARADA